MKNRTTRYFRWLLDSKSKQEQLKNTLADNGADVYSCKNLTSNEVIKFRQGNKIGILFITGYANPEFIRIVKGLI